MKNLIIAIAVTLTIMTTGCATTGIQLQQEVQYSHKCENPRYRYTLSCRAHQMHVRMAEMQKAGRCTNTAKKVVEGGRTITRTITTCK
jgi:hypothetical protein